MCKPIDKKKEICFIYSGSMELTLELIGKLTIKDLLERAISEMNLPDVSQLPPKSYTIHNELGVSVPLDATFDYFDEDYNRLFLNHDSHYWHVKYINQEDAHGCAVACIAMVTKRDYGYVKKYFSGKDFVNSGISFFDYNEFFLDHGYACNWMWQTHQASGLNKPHKVWPPKLWADIHIVVVLQHSNISHAIVMKRDGTILDPMNKNIKSLDEYKKVSQVIGIYRHA